MDSYKPGITDIDEVVWEEWLNQEDFTGSCIDKLSSEIPSQAPESPVEA